MLDAGPLSRHRQRAGTRQRRAVPIDITAAPATLDITLHISAVAETLVVSAAQIDQPLSRIPDSVTVIPGAEIEAKQQFTLASALRSVPGLTLQQNGGPGTVTSLFTRGGESDFTLVLVDGIRANAFGGGLDLSQVPLQDVERIEVRARTAERALRIGRDRRRGQRHHAQRRQAVGAGADRNRQPRHAARRGRDDRRGQRRALAAGANYFEDAGFTGTGRERQDRVERRCAGDAGVGDRSAGVTRRAAPTSRATCSTSTPSADRPGAYRIGSGEPLRRRRHRLPRHDQARRRRRCAGMQPWFGARQPRPPAHRVRRRGLRSQLQEPVRRVGRQHPSLARARPDRCRRRMRRSDSPAASSGSASAAAARSSPPGRRRRDAGRAQACSASSARAAGTPATARRLPRAFAASASSRDALPGDPLAFQPRPDFPEETINSVNPKIAASFLVGEGTRLRGSFGTGIRPPDAFEIAFTDNSGLKPERSKSGEFGASQTFAGGAVQIDATAFFNSYTDLIISVGRTFSGSSRYRTDNISNARARGAEFSAAWRGQLRRRRARATTRSSTPRSSRSTDRRARRRRMRSAIRCCAGRVIPDRSMHRSRAVSVSAFAELQMRGETLDAEPAFGPSGGLYTNEGYTVVQPRRIVAAGEAARDLRARAEPLRSPVRRSAGLPGAGPHGLRGCPRFAVGR